MGSPSHHRIRPCTGRFWLAGVKAVGLSTEWTQRAAAVPPPYPHSTPKPGKGRGNLTLGTPKHPPA